MFTVSGIGKPLIYILDVLHDKKLHRFVKVTFSKKIKDSSPDRILCSSGNKSVNSVNFYSWQKLSTSNQEQENKEL